MGRPHRAQIPIFDPLGCESISHRFSHLFPNAPKRCRSPPLSALVPLLCPCLSRSLGGRSDNSREGPKGSLGAPKSKKKASDGSFGRHAGLLSNFKKRCKTIVKDSQMHTRGWSRGDRGGLPPHFSAFSGMCENRCEIKMPPEEARVPTMRPCRLLTRSCVQL